MSGEYFRRASIIVGSRGRRLRLQTPAKPAAAHNNGHPARQGGGISQILERIKQGDRIDNLKPIRQSKNGGLIQFPVTWHPLKDASGRIGAGLLHSARNHRTQAQPEAGNPENRRLAQYKTNPCSNSARRWHRQFFQRCRRQEGQTPRQAPSSPSSFHPETAAIVKECLATGQEPRAYRRPSSISQHFLVVLSVRPAGRWALPTRATSPAAENKNLESGGQAQKMESAGQLQGHRHDSQPTSSPCICRGHSSLLSSTPDMPDPGALLDSRPKARSHRCETAPQLTASPDLSRRQDHYSPKRGLPRVVWSVNT